jgi:hypothetical protein
MGGEEKKARPEVGSEFKRINMINMLVKTR